MRRWCFAHTKRGKAGPLQQYDREFATGAFLRFIGWKPQEFYNWLHGSKPLAKRVRPLLARFIGEWEAGTIDFTKAPRSKKRQLVRLEKPVRRVRLAVPFSGDAPRLQFLERKPLSPKMPSFADLIRPNLRNRTS